jgi:dihydroflavonol-4-reductase
MKILIVGGTGLTGAHAALYLREQGHEITLMSRSKSQVPCLQTFPFVASNYIEGNVTVDDLKGYDWLLFAAGSDIKQLPEGESEASFFERANTVAIPAFFEKAKQAGITRAVCIGSYYPQVVPETILSNDYVRSRHLSDEGVRALSDDSFNVSSLNAPFILGHVEGLTVPFFETLVQFAAGKIEGLPLVAPGGGVNHISSQSLSEAILSAFEQGHGGTAYLVGDENLSWKGYLEMMFEATGNAMDLPVSQDEHPLYLDIFLYAGRNAVIEYEPDQSEISYSRNRIKGCIEEVAKAYL